MLRFALLSSLVFLFSCALCIADEPSDAQQRILERYREILVKSPKRGATFDRVYNHYVDTGQSALFYQECQTATQNHPSDAGAWILLGLVAERRNQIEQAAKAFQTAADLEPDNHLPMLYLGELLLNQRHVYEATSALEQSHERLLKNSGSKNDLRTVLQMLALAYTRFGNSQKSLDVWNQLAGLFPNDPDILVQVAESMESEGKLDEALKQYRRLIPMTDDHAERVRFSLVAIDIMLRQGNDESALNDLDALLGTLDTESYLADAVRDRIDRIFVRDPKRQIEFYQKRIAQEPNDTASLLRLTKTFQKADRSAEAETLLLDTIKVSPTNISLRLMLIDLLVNRQDISGAVEQYQAIDKIAPSQTDSLIRWGTLILQSPGMTESTRRTEAAQIWGRIAENSPNDPTAAILVADLFARNRFPDEAEKFYIKAVELRPNDFAYRESLATFYHQQRRKDKVFETLLPADNRTFQVNNRAEIGQLFLTLQYSTEATQMLREAVQENPHNWTLQYQYLESLLRQDTSESIQDIRELFTNVEKQIVEVEQFSLFLQQEVQLLKSVHKIADVVKIVQSGGESSPSIRSLWHLAVLHQAEANFPAAVAVVERALDLAGYPHNNVRHLSEGGEPDNRVSSLDSRLRGNDGRGGNDGLLPLLRFAAELYEQNGSTDKAIAFYQKLVQDDPARSGDHWKQIITLHIQRGELSQALESSRNLLGHGTENAERLRFVADLFLSVNRRTEAVKLLQQALTYEPGNTDVLRMLAQTLADSLQHEEAIELLWRLYERLEHFSAKLSVIEILTNEYAKWGKSEDLVEHLWQLSRNHERRRESMQSLVRVFTIQGDHEEAQNVLETMLDLPEESKAEAEWASQWVLRELVAVAEKQDDLAMAVRYQEMLCQKLPDSKEQTHLFYLYDKLGDTAKARKLFFDQVLRQGDLQGRFDLIDTMIRRGQYDIVSQVLNFLEIHEPEHWGILFRRILIEAHQNKPIGNLVREFRAMQTGENHPALSGTPPKEGNNHPTFIFSDVAPTELNASLILQNQFLPVLFHPEMRRSRWLQGQLPDGFSNVPTFQDARFLVLGWMLREAMNKDFSTSSDTPTVMRQFRSTTEDIRDMLPADSTKHDILMERLRFEVWLLDLLQFDHQQQVFPTGMLKLQIDPRLCQQTIWQIVRQSALDDIADWQPALFQIFVTECINELVANRFKTVLPSDARLSEKLLHILDNLCNDRKIPSIPVEERDRMLNFATFLVKQSATDHGTSLRGSPVTLTQKTDRLLAIWTEFVTNASPEIRTACRHYFTSRYGTFLWILRSQNRETDAQSLELSLRKTAQSQPLWLAEHVADLTQSADEDLILFFALTGHDSLETQLQRLKNSVADILPFCTDKTVNRTLCELLFQHLGSLLQANRLQRYDIFTPSERSLFGLSTQQIWTYLQFPTQSEQGQFARQFFGIDSPYVAHQQILKPDQMSRLAELDRTLRQIADFAFYLLDELEIEPSDFFPAPAVLPTQKIALSRYRSELQGDRPIDRTIIYSLVRNPEAVSNFSVVDELFCRIVLLRRALDTKTQFVGTRVEERIVPIQENYTEQFGQFLENQKRSTVVSHRNWSHYVSIMLGDLLQTEGQAPRRMVESSSDAELLQFAGKLETEQQKRTLTFAEQLALALLYVRLQRFTDAVTTLDSMEVSASADLLAREWIIAYLARQRAKPDTPLMQRGNEAVNRLLNFRLSERDSLNLVPVLQYYNRAEEAQRVEDHLVATVSDRRLLAELLYKMISAGAPQKENAAKIAQRIVQNPAFLQNSRRLTSDVYLLESAIKALRAQNRVETVVPALESRLRGLRNRTDSRILLAKLYMATDRQEEAKALALELAQNPTSEPERRQMIVSLLVQFGLQRELETMNRLLIEQNEKP